MIQEASSPPSPRRRKPDSNHQSLLLRSGCLWRNCRDILAIPEMPQFDAPGCPVPPARKRAWLGSVVSLWAKPLPRRRVCIRRLFRRLTPPDGGPLEGGTDGSNPSSSSGESGANSTPRKMLQCRCSPGICATCCSRLPRARVRRWDLIRGIGPASKSPWSPGPGKSRRRRQSTRTERPGGSEPQRRWDESIAQLARLAREHRVELIAIGNGTASRETDRLGVQGRQQDQEHAAIAVLLLRRGVAVGKN